MIGYLLVLFYAVLNLGESIVVKVYAKRHGSGGMLMNAIIALFAATFFLVTDTGGFYIPDGMLPLAIGNAFLFATGFYLTYVAYQCGSYGLTCLVSNFALLFTIFYGWFALNEEATVLTYLGIVLVFVAMFLINWQKRGKDEKTNISLKWFLCVLISMIANGCIGILARYQQIRFDNACSNEFQLISIGGSFLILAVLGVIIDRKKLSHILRKGTLYGALAGLCNGGKNFLTLVIYLYLPISTVSPMKTGLGIAATFLASFLIFKEKYTKQQLVGVVLGALAVILLAL